jgi:hypothetical protein
MTRPLHRRSFPHHAGMPPPAAPTWLHPTGWLGLALGLALSSALIREGMRSAAPAPPLPLPDATARVQPAR